MKIDKTEEEQMRETLGKMVRQVWIAWAKEQPSPKPSWLVEWDGLIEPDKEVDRRIGESIYQFANSKYSAILEDRERLAKLDKLEIAGLQASSRFWQDRAGQFSLESNRYAEEIRKFKDLAEKQAGDLASYDLISRGQQDAYNALCGQLSAANAAIAMKDEALREADNLGPASFLVRNALNATPQQVSEWEEKKLEPLRKQVAMLLALITQPAVYVRISDLIGVKDIVKHTQAAADDFMAEHDKAVRAPLQYRIDQLMLEYCPDEMTPEQIEEWGKHQVPVDAKTQELIDRATAKKG